MPFASGYQGGEKRSPEDPHALVERWQKTVEKVREYLLKDVGRVAQSGATDYGLDAMGSNPGGDEIFRPS